MPALLILSVLNCENLYIIVLVGCYYYIYNIFIFFIFFTEAMALALFYASMCVFAPLQTQ